MGAMTRDILDEIAALRAAGEAFVLATVVRTVSVTAAKAGAKAVIRADGVIAEGWIGGGCARGAVLRGAREALADGQPRLISVSPEDVLAERGVAAGEERDGIRFARSMCPSRGTMDIFLEPVLPRPDLLILGASPVAIALADLGPGFGFEVTAVATAEEMPPLALRQRFVVVATQGRGDEAGLRAALAAPAGHVAFVGSRRKMAALRAKLAGSVPEAALAAVEAPAGLDIGAITPEEIALSILARIVMLRRQGQRTGGVE